MTEQEIKQLDNEIRREAQKKYLTVEDLKKTFPEIKETFNERIAERFRTIPFPAQQR